MAHGEMAFFARPSSSAVKIVAPSTASEPSSPKPSPRKDSTQRQCRNILIYGSCKYQDKGCIYYHPSRDAPSPVQPESPVPSAALPAQAVNAPVFVPKTPGLPLSDDRTTSPATVQPEPAAAASSPPPAESQETHDVTNPYLYPDSMDPMDGLMEQFQAMDPNIYETHAEGPHMLDYDATNAMDMFYTTQSTFARQPLNYHLYTQPRPEALQHRFFVSDAVREELQMRSETIYTAPAPNLNLPEELQGYHSLVPLEMLTGERRKLGSWNTSVYRAMRSTDGVPYALRRVENYRLSQSSAFAALEGWTRLKHPNVVSVREAFTTRAFSDNSLVVVYDYHPNAQTLYDAYIKPKPPQFQNGRLQAQIQCIEERTLWSYIIQIANAIKAIHDVGLAVRVVDPTKILLTGKNRVRLNMCGVVDILMFEARQDIALAQQEDLTMFGKLIFTLCCNNALALSNIPKAMETISRHYSPDVKAVAVFLIKPGPLKNIGQLFDMIGSRLLTELNETQNAVDCLEAEFMSELENGRLFRLLSKFGFINERPEFALDPRWSETGDRYIVKLFRDYVFHQVDEHGRPVVNLSHVLTCLNKLDAGTDERIMLVSRDEQSCLVVSYKEIKSCIESAFNELSQASVR